MGGGAVNDLIRYIRIHCTFCMFQRGQKKKKKLYKEVHMRAVESIGYTCVTLSSQASPSFHSYAGYQCVPVDMLGAKQVARKGNEPLVFV